jgi:hypothetical protein
MSDDYPYIWRYTARRSRRSPITRITPTLHFPTGVPMDYPPYRMSVAVTSPMRCPHSGMTARPAHAGRRVARHGRRQCASMPKCADAKFPACLIISNVDDVSAARWDWPCGCSCVPAGAACVSVSQVSSPPRRGQPWECQWPSTPAWIEVPKRSRDGCRRCRALRR